MFRSALEHLQSHLPRRAEEIQMQLHSFDDYIKRQWTDVTRPETVMVYREFQRTNNSAECFHSMLTKKMGRGQQNVLKFIKFSRLDSVKVKICRKRFSNGFFKPSSKWQCTESKWNNPEAVKNKDLIIKSSPAVDCFVIDNELINVTCQEEIVSSCRNDVNEVDSCTPDFACDDTLGNYADAYSQSDSPLNNRF